MKVEEFCQRLINIVYVNVKHKNYVTEKKITLFKSIIVFGGLQNGTHLFTLNELGNCRFKKILNKHMYELMYKYIVYTYMKVSKT